ncbi:MAG TPA: hypothetical protein VEF04_20705, partial [Blastocatellia bacterium]|nr:hypothetical protein [Blastocatellia bacterium]
MELTFNGHKAAIDRTLDWKTGGLIALSICGLLVGGQLLNIPLWALAALPAALAIGLATISSPRASLYVFAGTLFGLELRMRTTSQTDPLDIIAGAALMGIMAGTAIKLWLVERKQVSVDIPQLLFFLFFAWGTVTGIAGIFSWTNTWNSWIREITIYSPLLVVPILLTHYPLDDQREFSAFLKFLFWAALLSTIWMQFRYVLNVKSAIYAYEITRLSFDASSAMILLIACVASATFSLT